MKNPTEKNLEDQNKNHGLKNMKLAEKKRLNSEILKHGNNKNPFTFMPMGSGKLV